MFYRSITILVHEPFFLCITKLQIATHVHLLTYVHVLVYQYVVLYFAWAGGLEANKKFVVVVCCWFTFLFISMVHVDTSKVLKPLHGRMSI